jgi:hypothetical protein
MLGAGRGKIKLEGSMLGFIIIRNVLGFMILEMGKRMGVRKMIYLLVHMDMKLELKLTNKMCRISRSLT